LVKALLEKTSQQQIEHCQIVKIKKMLKQVKMSKSLTLSLSLIGIQPFM